MGEEKQILRAAMPPLDFDAKSEDSAEAPLLQPTTSFPIRTGFRLVLWGLHG